jgi:hypothetical protein
VSKLGKNLPFRQIGMVHLIRIYDKNPNQDPIEFRLFGFLRLTLDPPAIEPIIERTFPLHADVQQKIEEMIWRYELPWVRLMELDDWDGLVRPPKPEPEPEPVAPNAQGLMAKRVQGILARIQAITSYASPTGKIRALSRITIARPSGSRNTSEQCATGGNTFSHVQRYVSDRCEHVAFFRRGT